MYKLYKHQQYAVEKFIKHNVAIDMSSTGAGKTITQLELLKRRKSELNMVVCPLIVINSWAEQLKKFMPEMNVILLNKGSKKNKDLLIDNLDKKPVTFLISYQSAWRLPEIANIQWSTVIADECHFLKSPKAKVSKFFVGGTKKHPGIKAKFKSILSATLISNELWDAFMPIQWLSPEILGGNFYRLREFFYYKNPFDEYSWLLRNGAMEKFNKKILPYSVNFKLETLKDLPSLIHETIEVDMDAEQKRVYKELKNDLLTQIGDREVVVPYKISLLNKLLQVSTGFLYLENKDAIEISKTKLKALSETLEGVDGQVIIFYVFQHTKQMLLDYLDDVTTGVDAFILGLSKILIMQEGSAIGVNLQNAGTVIYFERDFSLVHRLQSIGRARRINSKLPLAIIDIVSSPIEKWVIKKLNKKQDLLNSISTTELKENI